MVHWKKTENEKGFIYYVNESLNTWKWDHPKFSDVKQAIDDCNYVAYSTYRLALKFRVLQRCLSMEEVPLSIILAIFKRHKLGNNESSLVLETCDLEAVLIDIFFATNKANHTNIDIDFASEIMINFLYNVYDSSREGRIQVIATKILLTILCNSSLCDLHKYMFALCADHNNCLTRMRLQGLLSKINMIIKYLHEDPFFGVESLNSAVDACFRESPGFIGITETSFMCWANSDVHFLSWIPLVFKFRSAETVMHSMKCTTCKTRPLLGLRYRCTKCAKYTQCQRCFLTGRISHSHKLSHWLREYSTGCSSKGSDDFLKKLYSLFCPRTIEKKYCIVRPSSQFANENIKPYQSNHSLCDVEPLSSPESQLQGVIRQLESQNRELQQILIFGNYSDKEIRKYLEEYRIFMNENIKKLKLLKVYVNNSVEHAKKRTERADNLQKIKPNIESTPVNQYDKIKLCGNGDFGNNMSTIMAEVDGNLCNYSGTDNKSYVWNKGSQSSTPVVRIIESKITDNMPKSLVKLAHNDLDEALAKLQQILANNFSLEDSLNNLDNSTLKYAVTEVEGMLTSIIDNVESSRCNSVIPGRTKS